MSGSLLWRGNANAWECDELGHLNVMFYITKAMQALETLSHQFGMHQAFSQQALASLQVNSYQVRYLAEARAGAPPDN